MRVYVYVCVCVWLNRTFFIYFLIDSFKFFYESFDFWMEWILESIIFFLSTSTGAIFGGTNHEISNTVTIYINLGGKKNKWEGNLRKRRTLLEIGGKIGRKMLKALRNAAATFEVDL